MEIIKPRIETRKINDYGEQFRPMVTSPYTLIVSDGQGQVIKHDGYDIDSFKKLLRYPAKPLAGFVTIANILGNSSNSKSIY